MESNKLRELIIDNQSLIYSIVHKFRPRDYDDLFQAGCLGLIKAYKSFKSEYNTKFTTYAYQFIVGEIYKAFNNNRNIHMSPENIKLLNSLNRAVETLTNHLGRMPTDSEIANFLEIDLYRLYELRSMSLVESLDYNYENNELYDFVSVDNLSHDDLISLRNAISHLTIDEQDLIRKRYFQNITQSTLARERHTNQVKIYREEQKILEKLKSRMVS